MHGVGAAGDTAGVLIGAAVGGGVIAASAEGAFLVGDAGAMDMSVELAFVATDWLAEVFADGDDVACYVYTFAEKVVGGFWGRTDDFE
jgi:hypothetical protein